MTDATRAATARMPNVGRLLAAQVAYQARLLASGRAVTIGVIFPIILLIASHSNHAKTTGVDVAGYAAFGLTITAWNTYGIRLVAAREAGILKRWRATPLPRWCYFSGRILATVVVAVAAGAATVAAAVLLYHVHLSLSGALGALVVFALGACAWAATATAVSSLVSTVDSAGPTFLVTYFPVVIISSVLGTTSEPHWLTRLATYLPAEPIVHAAGVALSRTAGQPWLPARDLAVLAAWAAGGIIVGVATFRWEPHRPTQRHPARTPLQANPSPDTASLDDDDPSAANPPVQFGSTRPSSALNARIGGEQL